MTKKTLFINGMTILIGLLGTVATTWGAPSVADALKLAPVQQGIEYDKPVAADIDKCTIKAEKKQGATAWVVRDPSGQVLRSFADSSSDNVVDTWSYYQNGLVIYRDIDSDFNSKADQYRWFHAAGSRWGVDQNEDGKIDRWKSISAEEVAEEVVAALCQKDGDRFRCLLLSDRESNKLGLAKSQAEKLTTRIKSATATFRQTSGEFPKDGEFTDFGGLRPGIVPAGTRGLRNDLLVYENVWAMVLHDGQHRQLQLGTMVKVGDAWKLVDGPMPDSADQIATGFFFEGGSSEARTDTALAARAPTEKMQVILTALEKLDQEISTTEKTKQAVLHAKRAGLLEQLAGAATTEKERDQWLTQLADMVSAAVQDGSYPQGLKKLKSLETKLAKQGASSDLLAYFQFHRMLAEYYGVTLADPKVDYAKSQAKWLEALEKFVDAHPKSELSAEALLQLAMESDMTGDSKAATVWYRRIVNDFPQSASVPKAKGAVNRLTSVGRTIALQGNAVRGGKVDLRQLRGKVVVIQYWNTSSPTCSADHLVIKDIYAKYGGRGLEIIGVNLDYTRDALLGYLKKNRLPWKQLYEQGGFESRLANEMGVITSPLMLLVDQKGIVVNNNIQAAELEAALKQLSGKRKVASRRK